MGILSPKWVIGILTAFVMLTLISGLLEGTYLGPNEVSTLQSFVEPPILNPQKMLYEWLPAAWNVLWFNYSFFYGDWAIVKYIFFWPISAGVIVSVGGMLIQALASALGGLVSRLPLPGGKQ